MSSDVLRLVAASSVTGPRDLADLARLLDANGMRAAAWIVEQAIEELAERADYDEVLEEIERLEWVQEKISDIEKTWRQGKGVARYAYQALKEIREQLEDETG